ncbi:Hemerythrin HHE cation binding domain [Fragilaria crotonensis]|nr:Hemerythrin HHE cation binding domain [Fragilaria crotonensis]
MKCVLPLLPVVVLLKSATAAFNGTDITSAPFDPTEPVYQIHDKYPPVMTSTWTYGVQHDGWWIAHEALRGEVNDFQMALESLVSIPSASTVPAATAVTDHSVVVIAMQKWWRGHLKHMHSHHRNEDRIIKRFATQRFRWPDFVENDHQEILQRLDAIDTLVQRIVEIGTSVASSTGSDNTDRISPPSDNIVTCITELKSLWTDYNRVILQHLDQEEEVYRPYESIFPSETCAKDATSVGYDGTSCRDGCYRALRGRGRHEGEYEGSKDTKDDGSDRVEFDSEAKTSALCEGHGEPAGDPKTCTTGVVILEINCFKSIH